MTRDTHLLNRAIRLADAGKQEDARRLLLAVIRESPHNEAAWLRYIETLATPAERLRVYEQWLRAAPSNQRARQGLAQIRNACSHSRPSSLPAFLNRPALLTLAIAVICASMLLVAIAFHIGNTLYQAELYELQDHHEALAARAQALQQAYSQLSLERDMLQAQRDSLEQELASLTAYYNQLSSERDTLRQEYDRVAAELSTTISQLHTLEQSYSNTVAELNAVRSERDSLQGAYYNLAGDYEQLAREAITPPYIYIHGRVVYVAFKTQNEAVAVWPVPFEALEANIQRGHQSRQKPLFLALNTTQGTARSMDFRPYVDPAPFHDIVGALYHQSASDEAFIREVWHIVAQLTVYSSEIEETPRYPLETLLAGGGDCEDTAILFASMIAAAPVNWDVQLVYMDANNRSEPREANHVIVFIDTGSAHYHVETTSKQEMQPFTSVTGWYFAVN